MKFAVEMGPGATIYTPSFIKTGSGIQKLMRNGVHRHTHTQHSDRISLLSFFQNKENKLKLLI
jgi:hypothetical protein